MNIDKIDRDNLIRMVLSGRLDDLRVYAKALIEVQRARERVDASGRGGIRFFLPTISPVKPDPEIVVLESTAINSARDLSHTLKTAALEPRGRFDVDIIEWFDTYIGPPPSEPVVAPGGVTMPVYPTEGDS